MDTNNEPLTSVTTVNEILDLYETQYVPNELAPRTQIDYRRHIVKLRGLWGPRVASELKPKDFATWLNANGLKRGRIQRTRMLAVLSSAFSEAVSTWWLLERNVLRDVKRFKNPPRDRLVAIEEYMAVRAIAPLRLQIAMDLAVITGQRQGDILDLKWSQIKDLPEPVKDDVSGEMVMQELLVTQSKTGKRLGIGITKDLEAVLDKCWQLQGRCEYILSRTMGGRFTSTGFRALWQRSINRATFKKLTERYTFHDLRALAATRCPTPEIAMRLLGHSNIAMTLRIYRRGIERVTPIGGWNSEKVIWNPAHPVSIREAPAFRV